MGRFRSHHTDGLVGAPLHRWVVKGDANRSHVPAGIDGEVSWRSAAQCRRTSCLLPWLARVGCSTQSAQRP